MFGRLPSRRVRVWQWHEATFELPEGAVRLASSELVPNQAFRYGRAIYGVQFHLEMNRDALSSCACPRSLPFDAQAALADAKKREREIRETAQAIFGGFLALSNGAKSHDSDSVEIHPLRDRGRQE